VASMSEKVPQPLEFTPETFRFLRELAKNNDRTWFRANEDRYAKYVLAPSLAFVRAVGPKLGTLSRHLVADDRPVGGSMMRLYRDVRFSKDKSPYRTSVGIRFIHEKSSMTDPHFPGFIFHLAPGDSWVYAGMWRPEPSQLDQIRRAIVARSTEWNKVRRSVPEIEGESLKRPPRGFDPAHPMIDDLKRKGYFSGCEIKDPVVTGPGFPGRFVALCQTLNPLNRFLAKALGVAY